MLVSFQFQVFIDCSFLFTFVKGFFLFFFCEVHLIISVCVCPYDAGSLSVLSLFYSLLVLFVFVMGFVFLIFGGFLLFLFLYIVWEK